MAIESRKSWVDAAIHALVLATAIWCLTPAAAAAQGVTGALIATVTDEQNAALVGAAASLSSPALIGGPLTQATNDHGQLRFPMLPPGIYVLDIELAGFARYHEEEIRIGANLTIARTAVLKVGDVTQSIAVVGSRIDARDPGFGTRVEELGAIPTRRSSMFDAIRSAPGVSPTSPSSGTTTTVSAFGSGTNENQFLIDGTNFTCPCNGIARAEPGVDFIQEIQIQAVGASAEYGNVQGAVINVVTRQGSERFLYDAAYYGQPSSLTSQPVQLTIPGSPQKSGYGRARYRDFATDMGGPAVHNRLWFFGGYQYLRDYDSQPGTDPDLPRKYEQNKTFAKLTWRLAPKWELVQSLHNEAWVSPEQPTIVKPFEATLRSHATVPAVTFGHLTNTLSANTVWDVRVGRFVYSRSDDPSTGDRATQGRSDSVTGVSSGAPQSFGTLALMRTTAKATLSHYRPGLLGADHQWKVGWQIERGEHITPSVIPGGIRFVDKNGLLSQTVSSNPSTSGGLFITTAGFVSDAITLGDRVTINAGFRFDHSRAISQDIPAIDAEGRETDGTVRGLGTLYTWNVLSPRLGITAKLSADGRTILRGSYGRFSQGVLTGEIGPFHPGVTPVVTTTFDPATGNTIRTSTVDQSNLLLDSHTRAPRTDEYSVGVDREIGRRIALAVAYIRKDGANFIGWTDVAGLYRKETRRLADDRILPVFVLDTSVTPPSAQRFLLTNQDNYSLTYDGLVMAVEKRRSHGWQALGSYTLSRAFGLQPSSGTNAAGAQASTVAPPPAPGGLTFGRDPNDLTNATGRLPNDRPHMFRAAGSIDVPRTGFVVAANLQYFSGKPWSATAVVTLPQNSQRIQLEPRGSERLSSQTLLNVRLSRPIPVATGRIELLLDVLNLLNDTAEEGLVTDTLTTETVIRNPNFGTPNVFIDPRRAMISVRVNLGR